MKKKEEDDKLDEVVEIETYPIASVPFESGLRLSKAATLCIHTGLTSGEILVSFYIDQEDKQ